MLITFNFKKCKFTDKSTKSIIFFIFHKQIICFRKKMSIFASESDYELTCQ